MSLSLGQRLINAYKAANYHAKVGDVIAGNLTRGAGGQFAAAGSGDGASSADKPQGKKPSSADANSAARDKLRQQQQADRQALADQAKQDKITQATTNVSNLAEKLLDSDMAEVLTTGDTPGDISGVNPEYGDKLIARGLAVKYPDGSYDLSPTGKSMVQAMAKGDERKAKQAIMRAQANADRKAAIAAKPKRKKKELSLGERILIAYKAQSTFGGVKRGNLPSSAFLFPEDRSFPVKTAQDIKDAVSSMGRSKHPVAEIKKRLIARAKSLGLTSALPASWSEKPATKTALKETNPQGSFTAYKDANNQWRWVSVSSSGFQDHDGETVSTKALSDDCARCDATKNYGPLKFDWWHTPILIGDCDFNAMHGPLLIESGIFYDDRVAQAFDVAIKSGRFVPGISLTFQHNEPGPPVLPGRVFNSIRKMGRSLLPADKASNLASSMELFNQGYTKKEVIEKMETQKASELEALIGPELTAALLGKSELAIKTLQMAGVAYKAAAALDAPMSPNASGAAQLPAKKKPDAGKVAEKDDPMVSMDGSEADPMSLDTGDGDMPEDDSALEDSQADQDSDAILQGLFDTIGKLMTDKMSAFASEIQSALAGLNSTATKEAGAVAIALKEIAGLLPTLALKEQVDNLDARLKSLEGEQPAIVQKRASQQPGITADQLPEVYRNMVAKEAEDKDPYISNAEKMAASLFESNPWLAPKS